MDMLYLDNLPILRDLYYRLSEKKIFFEDDRDNDKLVQEYIQNYCETYGMLDKYRYFVEHIMLLRIALHQGRAIQIEADKETLGLTENDRWLIRVFKNWNTMDKEYVASFWEGTWKESKNKDKFIQEYGKELIDEIIKEVEKIQVADYIKRRKEKEEKELKAKKELEKKIAEYEKNKRENK